ncbi:hypothetical protein [Nocardioides cavernaquae]|uniref:Uncharacterized protein n=1 Tax=Nocardioides cavernaquae TaxID=2321396 RepID=A0A3A5H6M2_9ACTN|nr:hypothetical protein [Nocardioides cavernaquae]RJS45611.1 hypothetical protein D4739_04840 [Nocardioides cavernaquae]
MTTPAPEALPFVVRDGWPESIDGTAVTFYEAGLVLGDMAFDLPRPSSRPQHHGWLTVRIDAHQAVEEWKAGPPRRLRTVRLHVPVEPVLVPESALRDNATFGDWINSTHGFFGRLLVWDESLTWWAAHDADLELVITSAPPAMFGTKSDKLSWLEGGSQAGVDAMDALRRRYGVAWDD